ncbi:FAD-dependent monooxygenase [Nocardioides sp. TF02-7]|uniref:FAD-dependent monooxygenase n=1 Tax=Nocardioides sp. TF02-7 TaxID=2917724 RepID=UPI0023DC05A2|nr:FAD-dependent monooxygenase [Nocardioides sp. TF02-7]
MRRLELMLHDGEDQDVVDDPARLRALLAPLVPDPARLDVIRARVYTHHARVAGRFRSGRVLLAGDAAHLMPVWQGQGFNSGIRDAANLAWKLAAVLRGHSGDALLDTYDVERRPHATAMVNLSTLVGRIISPTRLSVALARDAFFRALGAVPAAKSYLTEMRFKPMPRYEEGAVAHATRPLPQDSPSAGCSPSPGWPRATAPWCASTTRWATGSPSSSGATPSSGSSTQRPARPSSGWEHGCWRCAR